jgi:hypothetical protein
MSNLDNFEKMMANNRDALNSRPSDEAWNRLSHRLKQRETPPPSPSSKIRLWPRYLAAASILLVVAGALTVFFNANTQKNKYLVEFIDYSASDSPITRSTPEQYYAEEIESPDAYKDMPSPAPAYNITKEVASKKVEAAPQTSSSVRLAEERSKDLAASTPNQMNELATPTEKMASPAPSAPTNASIPEPYLSEDRERTAQVLDDRAPAPKTLAMKRMSLEINKIEASEKETKNEASEADEPEQSGLSAAFENEQHLNSELAKNDANLTARSNAPHAKFKAKEVVAKKKTTRTEAEMQWMAMNWLMGTWQNNSFNGTSIEKWQSKNSLTIEGSAYRVVGKDTIFTEKIIIQREELGISLLCKFDASQGYVRYQLYMSHDNNMLFIQAYNPNAPNEIEFKGKNKNEMVVSYRFNRGGTFSDQQKNYLQNRNNLNDVKASRALSRKN